MAIKTSTGLREALMVTGSFASLMNGGKIKIFSGDPPASADAAETGTLLCTITNNATSTGLTFAASAPGGVLSKDATEVWLGNNVASGTAGYYRFVQAGDTGALSTTQYRYQGTVANVGADMNISNPSLVIGAPQRLNYHVVTLPTP